MTEALVVRSDLTDSMIQAGAELTRKLDERGWPVVGAFWYFLDDVGQWKLVFASPEVNREGPQSAYETIQDAERTLPEEVPQINLQDIWVMDPANSLIQLFSQAIDTGPGISRIRFREQVINGILVEDALVYRLALDAA